MATAAELKEKLEKMVEARDRIIMGESEASISYDGKSVSYTRADINQLNMRIYELKTELGQSARRAFNLGFHA